MNKYQKALESIIRYIDSLVKCESLIFAIYKNIDVLKELVDKETPIKIKSCTCERCNTYNETWRKRMYTVSKDVVYCWHCGQAHEFDEGTYLY